MVQIRPYAAADWPLLWPLLQRIFDAGETYAYAPGSAEADIHQAWITVPQQTWVACTPEGTLVGSYVIKPNQPGLGAHVCNCGYVVDPQAAGQGIASQMCVHSQQLALELGFRAMQFNLVVASNERAVRLWQRLGFHVVGRLPGAFRHSRLGYVDALVMFKQLVTDAVTGSSPDGT